MEESLVNGTVTLTTNKGTVSIYSQNIIGEGSIGKVYSAKGTFGEKIYNDLAIKHVPTFQYIDGHKESNIIELNHKNIVKVYDIAILQSKITQFSTIYELFIIMERCDYDLKKFITSNQIQLFILPYDEILIFKFKCEWIKQMINSLMYIHEKRLIHRDIKPSNFLIKKDENNEWILKLSDFGYSRKLSHDNSNAYTYSGTRLYQAPEFWRASTLSHSKLVDVWSFGVIFIQLFCCDMKIIEHCLTSACQGNKLFDSQKFLNEVYDKYPFMKQRFSTILPMIFQLKDERSYFDEIYNSFEQSMMY